MEQPAPFHCTFTPGIPELLTQLKCTLVLSTYQAGKVIFLSAQGAGLIQLPRAFQKPMGLAVDGNRMAVATRHEIIMLANDPRLAAHYPGRAGQYDGLFVPRARYLVNEVDIHDMVWSGDTLWVVNTLFSHLCTIDLNYNFVPRWHPPFITELAPEDRCHMNGLALVNGQPAYVSALGSANVPMGWRETRLAGGVLINVTTREIVLNHLPMPHSPRVIDDQVYLLLSLPGEVVTVNPQRGTYETLARLPGYLRGMAHYGDYLFIGMSKQRPGRVLGDLNIAPEKMLPGIGIVNRRTGQVAGLIQYHTDCEEIYDVQVLPGLVRPGILGINDPMYQNALSTPEQCFWGMPVEDRPSSN